MRKVCVFFLSCVCLLTALSVVMASATTVNDQSTEKLSSKGLTVSCKGSGDSSWSSYSSCDISEASGIYTVRFGAKSISGWFGGSTPTTTTITITNTSGYDISFDYSTDGKTFTNKQLANEGTLQASVSSSSTSSFSYGYAYIKNIVKTIGTSTITVAPTTNGTFVVNGTSTGVDANGNGLYSTDSNGTLTFKATPDEGFEFFGFVVSGKFIYVGGASAYQFEGDTTITPHFVKSDSAMFSTGGVVYPYLDTALSAAAASTSDKKVITVESGVAYGANNNSSFTIASGVTLLIPCDAAYTQYTSTPGVDSGYTTPSVFRKLVFHSGSDITVNGALCISAKQSEKMGYNGAPSGACGVVDMQSNSSITVNSQANLYAWGFIGGAGTVTIKNGATVYESFQLRDWRGGDGTSKMTGQENQETYRVFPISQYYVQNVQVPMKLEAGAEEICYISVNVSNVSKSVPIAFIGENGMFAVTNGSLTKDYDESTDRLIVSVDGDTVMQNLSIEVSILFGAIKYTMDSQLYVMNFNGNISVKVNSGTVAINQDIALIPGAYVEVAEGAKVVLGDGHKLIVYDRDEWVGKGNFIYNTSDGWKPILYVYPSPYVNGGKTYVRESKDIQDAAICVNGTVDLSGGYVYTTQGGANIYSTGTGKITIKPGSDTVAYQATQSAVDGKQVITYVEIPITPAILQNSAGYNPPTQATSGATTATTYCYDGLKWYIPNATLNGLTVEYRLDDYLWLNAYFTLKDITVTQDDVKNKVLTVNNGAELYVTNGKVYLVKKIPADQIPDDQTFIVTYNNGTAQVTAPFSANLTDLRANTTDEKTKTLIDKLLVYGDAAKLYFENGAADGKLSLDLTTLPDREKAKDANKNYVDAENVGSGTDKLLSIKGMNVLFEERLSLMVAIQLKKDTALYDITSLGSGNVAQIGLLVGEKDGGILTVDNLGTYGKAYILYGNSNKIASDNVPVTEKDLPVYQAANKETTDWNSLVDDEGRTVIYLDLKSSEYTSSFELRPFVILNDGTVMYAAQYEYGLGAYIKSILSKENLVVPEGKDANAFRNLLVRTWEYALAADLCF